MTDNPSSISFKISSPSSSSKDTALMGLSTWEIAEHCIEELNHYQYGVTSSDQYSRELLYRATVQGDQEAWAWMQHCFSGMLHNWLHRHPNRNAACRLESAENYVAQAFESFWQVTTVIQRIEFNSLAGVLQYLRASLNGVILDTLRAYRRPGKSLLQEPEEAGESLIEDPANSIEMWEHLQAMLPNKREQRLAYLLFNCNLKPGEIVRFCPQEFSDIHEIYQLRRSMMERLLRNADIPNGDHLGKI